MLLHQTVIGLEAKIQLEKLDEFPDVVVAGGNGADFAGLAFPFLQEKLAGRSRSVFVLAEPAGSPKLTQGVYAYDVDDSIPGLPLSKMYTLCLLYTSRCV